MGLVMTRELREYQIRAIDFWLENKFVYNAIDMGLGKTAIALHALTVINKPALVLAPLEVAYNSWPDEIYEWNLAGEFDFAVLHGARKTELLKRKCTKQRLDIINYEGLKWLYKELFKLFKAKVPMPYKVLIMDESTAMKDPSTDRFKYAEAMRDMFSYITALSGTPVGNSLKDLWSQYYILDKGESLGKNYRDFEQQYFEQNPYNKYDIQLRFGAEHAIYRGIAGKTFRLQSSDYIDLPERVFHTINLELPDKLWPQYKSFEEDFLLFLDQAVIKSFNKASLNSKLRQFVQGAIYENIDDKTRRVHVLHDIKVNALKRLVEQLSGRPLLCFTQFQFEIPLIRSVLPSARVIDSSVNRAQRQQIFKEWNAKKIPLLVAHPRTISKGLNLQFGGSYACWFAQTYSLLDYQQANKRLHRSGQTEVVTIIHLAIKNTVDALVAKALQQKGMTQEGLLEFLRKETKCR